LGADHLELTLELLISWGHVDRVVRARGHVEGELLAVVRLLRVVGPAAVGDHAPEERIRSGGEIGRGGPSQDVLDLAHGEPVDLSGEGFEQMLPQSVEKVGAASLIVGERPPQALDRT
jgi:hypothetical protein